MNNRYIVTTDVRSMKKWSVEVAHGDTKSPNGKHDCFGEYRGPTDIDTKKMLEVNWIRKGRYWMSSLRSELSGFEETVARGSEVYQINW